MKTSQISRQSGFSIVEIFIVLIVIVAIGGIGYWRLSKSGASTNVTSIKINTALDAGSVNKKVFGEHVIAVSLSGVDDKAGVHLYARAETDNGILPTKLVWDASNSGYGIWNTSTNKVSDPIVQLSTESGVSVARWPGGDAVHFFDWKQTVGAHNNTNATQRRQMFGLPEFMEYTEKINAQAIIEIAEYLPSTASTNKTGEDRLNTPQNAADLVEYLNSPDDGSNPNGGTNWARQRSQDGHPSPYKVKYFEYGCETYYKKTYAEGKLPYENYNSMTAAEYVKYYFKMKNAMLAVDPTIRLGAVMTSDATNSHPGWDEALLEADKQETKKIDFLIYHSYIPQYWRFNTNWNLKKDASGNYVNIYPAPTTPTEIFNFALASGNQFQKNFDRINKQSRDIAGREIPLAVTEYNTGFGEKTADQLPYRFTLGSALINADMINVMLKNKNNVLLANFHQFINSYFGSICTKSIDPKCAADLVKRPVYYVHEMYNKYIGTEIIGISVDGPTKTTTTHWLDHVTKGEQTYEYTYLSASATKSADGKTVYLMVINKDQANKRSANIDLGTFVGGRAEVKTLNGSSVQATNEVNPTDVHITSSNIVINDNTFEYSFEPHSLTAIVITKDVPNPRIASLSPTAASAGQYVTVTSPDKTLKGSYKVYWHYPKDDANFNGNYLIDTVSLAERTDTLKFKIPNKSCKLNSDICVDLSVLAANMDVRINLQDSLGQYSNPVQFTIKR